VFKNIYIYIQISLALTREQDGNIEAITVRARAKNVCEKFKESADICVYRDHCNKAQYSI